MKRVTEAFSKKILIVSALFIMICATLVVRSLSESHAFPIFDEIAYLNLSRTIAKDGVIGTIRASFAGQNKEDKRNPLYSFLTAPFMNCSPTDFSRAKLITLSNALLLVLVVLLLTSKRWGIEVGIATAALVGLSPALADLSHTVLCDVLFAVFYFVGLWLLMDERDSVRQWCILGLIIALAYLTKANGHFLYFSAIVVGLHKYGLRFLAKPILYLSLIIFFLVSSFLIIRNLRVWHSPFYTFGNKVMWLDRWEYVYFLADDPKWQQLSFASYFAEHSVGQMIARMWFGVKATFGMLLMSMSVGLYKEMQMTVTGFICFVLAVIGGVARWRRGFHREILDLISTSAVLFAAFSWSVQSFNTHFRYTFPFAVSLFPLTVIGAQIFLKKVTDRGWIRSGGFYYGVGGITLILLGISLKGLPKQPFAAPEVPEYWQNVSTWIQENVDEKGFLIDNWSPFSTWSFCDRDKRVPYPFDVPTQVLKEYSDQKGIRFAFVDQYLIVKDRFKDKYGMADEYGPTTLMGWPRCYYTEQKPSIFLIYGSRCPK